MTQNPVVKHHALKRANERFGIPKKDAHSWVVRKFQEAKFLKSVGKEQRFVNGGVVFVVKYNDTILTILENR